MPSSSSIWSVLNSYGVRIKINFIFLFINLLLKKLIKTFSALIIFWIPIVSTNYGASYTRDFFFFFNLNSNISIWKKKESSLWLLIDFCFFLCLNLFFYNFFMAFPLKEESYVSSKRMLSGQNMESLQKLTLSGTHFHKIKRP